MTRQKRLHGITRNGAKAVRDVQLDASVIPTEIRQLISLEAELLPMPGEVTDPEVFY